MVDLVRSGPLPPWLYRVVGGLVLIGLLGLGFFLSPAWEQRNRGGSTTCSAFLKMSADKQARVIEKRGFNTAYATAEGLAEGAVDDCARVRHTREEHEPLDVILGP